MVYILYNLYNNIIGRHHGSHVFADFIWDGALSKKPKLYSPGSQIRTFLYLEDMVAAVFGIPLENTIFIPLLHGVAQVHHQYLVGDVAHHA